MNVEAKGAPTGAVLDPTSHGLGSPAGGRYWFAPPSDATSGRYAGGEERVAKPADALLS